MARDFSDATGAAVNWDKCCGFWHGLWATTPSTFEGISWACVPGRYLGTSLGSLRNSRVYTGRKLLPIWGRRASKWKHRYLSILARATVCNVFLSTKQRDVLQFLHCDRMSIQKFHCVFATFIWCSGWEPMRRDNLFRRFSKGGLGLSHLFVRQLVTRFMFLGDQKRPLI